MLRVLHNTKIDFIGKSKLTSIAIAAFILPALVLMLIFGFKTGIEFTGGTLVEYEFVESAPAPDLARIREAVSNAGFPDAGVQTFGSPRQIVVRAQDEATVQSQATGAERVASRIGAALKQAFPQAGAYREVRSELIGPRVGAELRRDAAIAMAISFLVSLIYLAWRFDRRLGLASVLANVHDIVATFAFIWYAQIEINLFVVGGILTVIGYSLADKVVVFDRVRELLKSPHQRPLRETLNIAINETLPRTVMTGTTVLACLLALILLGGSVLRPFALVLFFGIVVGTFSSIYVAGPILLMIEKRNPGKRTPPPSGRPASDRARGTAPRDTVAAR